MNYVRLIVLSLTLLLLSGCLYPENRLSKNQVPNETQLEMIQEAVLKYKEAEQGLLPIKTKDQDTPIFQKYPIDFSKLKEKNLITEAPGSAFENGGIYQYVIIRPDDQPTVKVLDLRLAEELRSLKYRIDAYRSENKYPPFDTQISKGIYDIDHKKIGMDSPPTVTSPYSQKLLPIYLDSEGNLLIDYRKDLYQFLQEYDHDYKNGDDIRYLLVDHAPFVPAYSIPYTVKDGEPVFMPEA
ncbi:hypothetical protein [Thalassobacillus hwangdonensis]|uniref:ABC transporter periplasmic binding protein yphF n=1 Tax=Thalassobacillus hwangdonensis TaxID=546108 RepID=A0ABW3KX82_9BACI